MNTTVKRLFSLLLCLMMCLAVLPTTALADDPTSGPNTYTSIEFKLADNKYAYGKSVASVTGFSSISSGANTFDPIQDFEDTSIKFYDSYDNATAGHSTADDFFMGGKEYFAKIVFKAKNTITLNLDISEAGRTNTKLDLGQPAGQANAPQISCADDGTYTAIFALPALTAKPFTIPFKSVVVKGGNTAPGETTFELELLNSSGGVLSNNSDYTYGTSFTINDVGTTDQQLTILANNYNTIVSNLVLDGIVVREKNSGAANWSYDDTAWLVTIESIPSVMSLTDETNEEMPTPADLPQGYMYKFYEAEQNGNGGWVKKENGEADEMTFTNTYTKNTSSSSGSSSKKTKEKVEIEIVKDNPETGAVGMPMQTVASLAGVVLVAGAAAYIRKKHMK